MPTRRGICCLLSLCWVVTLAGQGDTLLLSAACKDCTLVEILDQWQADYGLEFAYESGLVADVKVSTAIENLPLESALTQLLRTTDIRFSIVDNRYVLLSSLPVDERPVTLLYGRVLDAESGESLLGANVRLPDTSVGTQTDTDGVFTLRGRWRGAMRVLVSYLGYQTTEVSIVPVTMVTNETPRTRIRLPIAAQSMPVAVIREFTTDMLKTEPAEAKYTFRPERIPTLPGWGEPDVFRSLQLLPGISAADGSAANLNIRGGTADQNLYLLDGIPIYQAGHFFGQYSAFNPHVVKSVDVFRGGFAAQYGGRLSGVIDITSKPDFVDRTRVGVGLNLVNAHAFAEIPLHGEKSALLLGARRSYTDVLESFTYDRLFSAVFQDGRIQENQRDADNPEESVQPSFFYQDFNLKWGWKPSTREEVSFSAYSGTDRFNYLFRQDQIASRDKLEIVNGGFSSRYRRTWAQSETQATMTYSRFRADYFFTYTLRLDSIPSFLDYQQRSAVADLNLDIRHRIDFSPKHDLTVGGTLSRQDTDVDLERKFRGELPEMERQIYRPINNALYATYRWRPDSTWNLRLGFRAVGFKNQTAENGETLLEEQAILPRLRLSWRAKKTPLNLFASTGFYRQFFYQLPVSSFDLGVGEDLWVVADDELPSLSASDLTFGLHYAPGRWQMELELYRKRTENLSVRDLQQQVNPTRPFLRGGTAIAEGIDALLRYKYRRYGAWLAYSYGAITSTYVDRGITYVFAPNHEQRHQLNLTQMLALPRWDLSFSWHLASGRPFTEPSGIETRMNDAGDIR
ncbi:MAG: TonB-dependent receptor, partial [Bacteroidota bacterium]